MKTFGPAIQSYYKVVHSNAGAAVRHDLKPTEVSADYSLLPRTETGCGRVVSGRGARALAGRTSVARSQIQRDRSATAWCVLHCA